MPHAAHAVYITRLYIPMVCKLQGAIMETYTQKEKIHYILGLSGQNIIYAVITSSLAYYLQFTLLIPAVWVGIILSVSRIFDAVKDPFIGILINKSKFSFKNYLLSLPIPTAVLTVMCFTNGIYSSDNSNTKNILIIVSAFAFYIFWEIIFTLGDIPITAYPSILTQNKSDRTKLLSLRPLGGIACSIITLIIQPTVFSISKFFSGNVQENERKAFFVTVTLFSLIGGGLFQLTAIDTKERVITKSDTKKNQFKYFITNPLLKKISISGILGSFKSMTGIILTPLVNYYFAGKNSFLTLIYTALLGAGSLIGLIGAMTAVPSLTKKYNTRQIYTAVNLINIIPNILLFLLYLRCPQSMTGISQTIIMLILTLISGICISISSTVQTLIISEAVDLEERISGKRPTPIFFSAQTFIVKISAGISSFAASIIYSAIGFSSAQAEALNTYIANGGIPRLDNTYSVLMTALFFLYTIPCALSSLICVIPFINKKD